MPELILGDRAISVLIDFLEHFGQCLFIVILDAEVSKVGFHSCLNFRFGIIVP